MDIDETLQTFLGVYLRLVIKKFFRKYHPWWGKKRNSNFPFKRLKKNHGPVVKVHVSQAESKWLKTGLG